MELLVPCGEQAAMPAARAVLTKMRICGFIPFPPTIRPTKILLPGKCGFYARQLVRFARSLRVGDDKITPNPPC